MKVPPLKALRAFEAAARHGSFTQAGKELHVTHGAISQQVRLLEHALGERLFNRRGNRIRLTDSGQTVYEAAHQGLRTLEGIGALIRRPAVVRGEITISAPHGLVCHWLVHRLPELYRRYPGVRLRVIPSNDDEEIYLDNVDICIRYGDGAWPRRRVVLLSDIYLFPVCSPHLLRHSESLERPRDVQNFPILCADDGYEWNSWLESVGISGDLVSNRHYFGDALSAVEACRARLGVALGGNISSKHCLEQGSLIRPLAQSVRMSRSLFIISNDRQGAHASIDAVHDWFIAQFQ